MSPLVLLHGFTGSPASFDALCSALVRPQGSHGETRRGGDEESGGASAPEHRLRARDADALSSSPGLLVSHSSERSARSEPSCA